MFTEQVPKSRLVLCPETTHLYVDNILNVTRFPIKALLRVEWLGTRPAENLFVVEIIAVLNVPLRLISLTTVSNLLQLLGHSIHFPYVCLVSYSEVYLEQLVN